MDSKANSLKLQHFSRISAKWYSTLRITGRLTRTLTLCRTSLRSELTDSQSNAGQEPGLIGTKTIRCDWFRYAIAQRNYKYIVPIYYPRFDSISFLMPIFLDGAYSASPDFALVLQTDREHHLYIARTILDLESGYQDARLIAKPDESWLNPVTLK